jgi:RNA polymerase sigma-70 factor (ECF subfamily)
MGLPPSNGPPTSTTLLREIRDLRNRDQWRQFVDTYTPYLQQMLRRRGVSQQDSLDLIQETFIAVVDHIGDFRYDRSKRFRGWLATIALRKAWRHTLRDKRRLGACGGTANLGFLGDLPGDQISDDDEERRLSILLGRLRATLNELEWQVFELTVLGDTPTEEAAARLEIATGYLFVCRSRVKKALVRLLVEGLDE